MEHVLVAEIGPYNFKGQKVIPNNVLARSLVVTSFLLSSLVSLPLVKMLPDRTMYHSNYLLTPLLQLLGRLLGLEPHVLLFPFAENSFHKPTSTAA